MRSPEQSAMIPAAVHGTSTVDSTGPATARWLRPSVIISGVLVFVIAVSAYLATLIEGSDSDALPLRPSPPTAAREYPHRAMPASA